MIRVKRTNSSDDQFVDLVRKLDAELAIYNGDKNEFYSQFNNIDVLEHCVVALKNGLPIASGAIKPFDEQSVEIKRMFVDHEYRGQGMSKLILTALENWAKELGYKRCVLETGIFLIAAVGLYESQGYQVISNYEPYTHVDTSVCFEKKLVL